MVFLGPGAQLTPTTSIDRVILNILLSCWEFLALAYIGVHEGDIKENGCSALVIEMGSRLNDFADTAALIRQLVLVITVDTAVAHLAGAMGKPVWVALPFAADWRWMVETSESP